MNTISKNAKIAKLVDIEESVKGSTLYIADNVMIDSFVKIKFAGGMGDIHIGENTHINAGCVFYSGNGIYLERNVAIAANCTFASVNHAYRDKQVLISQQGFLESKGGIKVEEDAWIGANSVLLDGAHVKKGAVVGAGSVVKGIVEEYSIVAGNPLRVIGYRQ